MGHYAGEMDGSPGPNHQAKETAAWRAQHLCNEARRLDIHIEKLKAQAAEYRALAAKINPTSNQ